VKNKNLTVLLFIICFVSLTQAQDLQQDEIFVSSWKKGIVKIAEQSLQVKLTREKPNFEKEIQGYSDKTYRLIITPNYNKSLKGENWKVEFREVIPDKENNKEILGDDLLFAERPGGGGNNFPREDYIAYFYPNEERKLIINGIPWIEGKPFYPLKTVRKIQVENFLVTLKTDEVIFNETNKNKVDSFKIFIEFENKNLLPDNKSYGKSVNYELCHPPL
jgi:hypothetical protein